MQRGASMVECANLLERILQGGVGLGAAVSVGEGSVRCSAVCWEKIYVFAIGGC